MVLSLLIAVCEIGFADGGWSDASRDILVTIADEGARSVNTGVSAPYRNRKRYPLEAKTLVTASRIADEYQLVEIDRWPIRSLSVLCIVYRVSADMDRDSVVRSLESDVRVESAQRVQAFQTLSRPAWDYDDTYTGLQHGLEVMDVFAAHQFSRGEGVRVAIVDSLADAEHEDLSGRVQKLSLYLGAGQLQDAGHGTAVASVIAATANNARGIVGVAPESVLEVYVACWSEGAALHAVCDSFTLARALDAIVDSRPDVLNLSLVGPYDALLADLLHEVDRAGIVTIAARTTDHREGQSFPASLPRVIGVGSSDGYTIHDLPAAVGSSRPGPGVLAPGTQIMVAVPHNGYDFRSGSSLAAAHVSGVVALLLSISPNLSLDAVRTSLQSSQRASESGWPAVNACVALRGIDDTVICP
jgi:subtilisin family serine protease